MCISTFNAQLLRVCSSCVRQNEYLSSMATRFFHFCDQFNADFSKSEVFSTKTHR